MRRTLAILLATCQVAACGTVSDALKKTAQVLMDPSIQVGPNADQPTQIALSLYADRDVNPNPESAIADPAAPDTDQPPTVPPDEGNDSPYAIRLNGASQAELVESLRILLAHLQESPSATPPAISSGKQQAKAPVPPVAPRLASAYPAGLLMSLPANTATAYDGIFRKAVEGGTTAPPTPPSQQANQALAPGQYQPGSHLPDIPSTASSASPSGSELATPIAFKVLQLKDDSLLLNASAEQLWLETKKALGSTYLSMDDYVLLPGQFKYINFRPIDADANYIAVVANFRDPNASTWKQVLRVPPRGERYALLISFQGRHLALTDERHPPAPPPQSSRKP